MILLPILGAYRCKKGNLEKRFFWAHISMAGELKTFYHFMCWVIFNSLNAESFSGNINIYLYFLWFIYTVVAQVIELCGRQGLFILCNQYHGCRCPGSWRRQAISSHGIDLVHMEYSITGMGRMNMLVKFQLYQAKWWPGVCQRHITSSYNLFLVINIFMVIFMHNCCNSITDALKFIIFNTYPLICNIIAIKHTIEAWPKCQTFCALWSEQNLYNSWKIMHRFP